MGKAKSWRGALLKGSLGAAGVLLSVLFWHGVIRRQTSGRVAARMQAGSVARGEDRLPYRLFVPPESPGDGDRPLVLFLHGAGANGTDNKRQCSPAVGQLIDRLQQHEPTYVLVPQCPPGLTWIVGTSGAEHPYREGPRPLSRGAELALQAVRDVQQKQAIDPARVYVMGFSMGGTGVWAMVTTAVDEFAAAVPMSGANFIDRAASIADLPIWAFHGSEDPVSPAANACAMVARLRKLGSPVRYTEYEGAGHGVLERVLDEPGLVSWLLAQRRRLPPPSKPGGGD